MANGAAGHHGLSAHTLVRKVGKVELAFANIKSQGNLSRMAGVLENHNRIKRALIGCAQVHLQLLGFIAGIQS